VHNIEREIKILLALDGRARAPRTLAHCATGAVMGAPFLVMERLPGVVLDREIPAILDTPAQRRLIGEELADTLAELHSCDVEKLGLAGIGRTSIDHLKHVDSVRRLWEKNATRDLPDMTRLIGWLAANAPAVTGQAPRLVHSDFRLGNVLFAVESPTRLTATLDWETTILGDPLVDLGFLVSLYRDVGDDTGFLTSLSHVALGAGALDRVELARRYAKRTGCSLKNFHWYLAFALLRTAVMGEGLYRRYLDGLTQDQFYQGFREGVPELIGRALRWIESPNQFE
jgi:aminoglycoside phosphotransferase (APT) family kinase protein